jgi:Putative transposase of IS4/5 family (DUF4096)
MTITADTLAPEQLWRAVQPLLPPPPRRYGGRPRIDDRAALVGIVYQLRTGIPWRLLPPPVSLAAVARSPAGGGCATGSAPACGSSCTTNCWTSSAARASSTGRGPVWIRSACAPNGGRADRPEPDRPRQARVHIPPAGRPQRHPPGRRAVGGQLPRLGAAGGHGGCRAGDQGTWWAAWAAPQAARQAALRQGLRLPTLPAGAAPAGDHAQDRPAWRGVQPAAGPPPVCGGADAGVAGGLAAAAGPL